MGKPENDCQYYREQLVKDRERVADLEARGDDAVSDYDLRMGYHVEFNKQLKRNHIIYYYNGRWFGRLLELIGKELPDARHPASARLTGPDCQLAR